ncbi:DUF3348 domain-containing protein [soil metagenome]
MVRVSRRAGFTGSALVRWLASLGDLDVPESKQVFAERLSQWLAWTDAIALSAALDGSPAQAFADRGDTRFAPSAEEAECARVRAALTNAITRDNALRADKGRATPHATDRGMGDRSARTETAADAATGPTRDFTPHRRRYVARQQAMDASIGPLRARLRTSLAGRSPAMARLAAVDAVMEQLLGPREHHLLATVPGLLERHFERLAEAHPAESAEPPASGATDAAPAAWLHDFTHAMQGVLIAELDIRMQPVEGLLAALRSRSPHSP